MTREICKACNRPNPLGFSVPDEVWAAAVPAYLRGKTLCIVCFDMFATEARVDWWAAAGGRIKFWPVSGMQHFRGEP